MSTAVAEGLKSIIIAGVMGFVAHAGGRKTDKYYIFMAGTSYAGISFITAGLLFADKLVANPIVKGTAKFLQFLSGLGIK